MRATKGSDDFRALVSEKPAEPAPGKREGGFSREVSNGEEEAQMQGGESASWSVLNQIGVEVNACTLLLCCIAGLKRMI